MPSSSVAFPRIGHAGACLAKPDHHGDIAQLGLERNAYRRDFRGKLEAVVLATDDRWQSSATITLVAK